MKARCNVPWLLIGSLPAWGQFGYRKLLYVKEIFCTSELWQSLTTLTGSFERVADVVTS